MSYFKAKMHQMRFRLKLHPKTAGGAYSAPPGSTSWIKGGLHLREGREKGRERRAKEKDKEGKERKGEGKGRTIPAHFLHFKP